MATPFVEAVGAGEEGRNLLQELLVALPQKYLDERLQAHEIGRPLQRSEVHRDIAGVRKGLQRGNEDTSTRRKKESTTRRKKSVCVIV